MTYYTYFESSLMTILLTSEGTSLTGLYMDAHKYGPEMEALGIENNDAEPFPEAKRQLAAYFAGEAIEFDLPLAMEGTEFQKRVWKELTNIPYGVTISYGELAKRIGNPNASRAVGLANGRNPVSIIVPCHRVIGSNGKLVGYGGGLPRKELLLNLETSVRSGSKPLTDAIRASAAAVIGQSPDPAPRPQTQIEMTFDHPEAAARSAADRH